MSALRCNIVNPDRQKLEEVLPVDMPFTVAIDPCNLCNFKCKFCAIQYDGRKLDFTKKFMDLELFQKIAGDLKEMPGKLKVLRVSGQGEPLLNPAFCDMIKTVQGGWFQTLLKPSQMGAD